MKIIRHHDLEAEQRVDDRALYAPLREHRNTETVWPLLPGEKPYATFPACTSACNQGRRQCLTPDACRLPEVDEREGMGAIVVPVVIAGALAAAALIAMIGGWL
jgi:hypothetical protein